MYMQQLLLEHFVVVFPSSVMRIDVPKSSELKC